MDSLYSHNIDHGATDSESRDQFFPISTKEIYCLKFKNKTFLALGKKTLFIVLTAVLHKHFWTRSYHHLSHPLFYQKVHPFHFRRVTKNLGQPVHVLHGICQYFGKNLPVSKFVY